jgi:membrane-associated protease RseP (regulator of RpoE activity)
MLKFPPTLGDILVSVFLIALLFLWIVLQFVHKKEFEKRGIERSPLTLIFRSKKGLKLIDQVAKKRVGFFRKLGTVGAYISFPLIFLVFLGLFFNAVFILTTPESPPGVAPLLPQGVLEIEGAPSIPLEHWLIAIFTLLFFHEIMHGLMARAEDIPLKSLGLFSVTFLPLGAFVEPDDDVLEKKSPMAKLRVYAAGSVGNFIAAILVAMLFASMVFIIIPQTFDNTGLSIYNVSVDSPSERAGLHVNMTLLGIGDVEIISIEDFQSALPKLEPGVPITIRTGEGNFDVIPEKREGFRNGYIGIAVLPNLQVKPALSSFIGDELALSTVNFIVEMFYWIALLNLLVGLTNLLPIFPLDGGRMFALIMEEKLPKTSQKIISLIYMFLLALVIINIGPHFGLFQGVL